MNDEQILQQAWDKLMEGNAEAARTILLRSSTPAVQAFARRCENPTSDTAYEVRKDLEKYQRSIGASPSEGMALASMLQQAIAKNAPPGFLGNSQAAPTPKRVERPAGKGCFIATACYGAYDHPSVQEFRWFRDARLNQCGWGRRFIDVYYRCSPPIAAFLKKTPAIAAVVRRCLLAPILLVLRLVHDRNRI
jgi:hypothetical protein